MDNLALSYNSLQKPYNIAYTATKPKEVSFKGTDTDPYSDSNAVKYYIENAQTFFNRSSQFNCEDKYPVFLRHIPEGGSILDAGCGSGRDAKCFKEKGYDVTAFDRSPDLCEMASNHSGLPVITATFEDFRSDRRFDGIWTCNSLLVHIPPEELEKSLVNLTNHLKSGGVLVASINLTNNNAKREIKGQRLLDRAREVRSITEKHPDLELIDVYDVKNRLMIDENPFLSLTVQKL